MTNIGKKFNTSIYGQREFDPNETLKVLIHSNPSIYASWGVERKFSISDQSLILKVNGHHWQQFVAIVLAWNDTYSFYLVDENQIIQRETHDVYFDQLQELIDEQIERIAGYQF